MPSTRTWSYLRCTYLAILTLVLALLALPTPASAAHQTKTKPMSFVLTANSPVSVKISVPKETYSNVCFNFQFAERDALDPGEEVEIDVAPQTPSGSWDLSTSRPARSSPGCCASLIRIRLPSSTTVIRPFRSSCRPGRRP